MLVRIITSLIGLPLLTLFLYLGGLPLKIALFLLAVIGMNEFYRAVSKKNMLIHIAGYFFALIYFTQLDNLYSTNAFTIILLAFTLTVCVITVIFHESVSVYDAAVTFFGFCYVAVLISTVYLVCLSQIGFLLVVITFISAWGCDTGAYFTGRFFGRHKLAPKLSPKKTIEGAVGGTVLAAVLTALVGVIINKTSESDINAVTVKFALIGGVCAIFAQIGDLFASAIKRRTGIKDFGKILPGHGGVIDRFDSVLFTAPTLYIISLLLR